jgi:hypothetical protein
MTTWLGMEPDENFHTTNNGRTFLQPQLNKALVKEAVLKFGDRNLKDFLLFDSNMWRCERPKRDNTGRILYLENVVVNFFLLLFSYSFPTRCTSFTCCAAALLARSKTFFYLLICFSPYSIPCFFFSNQYPTRDWPSDHCAISCRLERVPTLRTDESTEGSNKRDDL